MPADLRGESLRPVLARDRSRLGSKTGAAHHYGTSGEIGAGIVLDPARESQRPRDDRAFEILEDLAGPVTV